jgi:hypothetical protein
MRRHARLISTGLLACLPLLAGCKAADLATMLDGAFNGWGSSNRLVERSDQMMRQQQFQHQQEAWEREAAANR